MSAKSWLGAVTLVSSGASISDNAFSTDANSFGVSSGFYTDFELTLTPTAGFNADRTIDLYARPFDFATNSLAPIPSTSYKQKYIGSFAPAVSSGVLQFQSIDSVEVPKEAAYYIFCNSLGAGIDAGWVLKAREEGAA